MCFVLVLHYVISHCLSLKALKVGINLYRTISSRLGCQSLLTPLDYKAPLSAGRKKLPQVFQTMWLQTFLHQRNKLLLPFRLHTLKPCTSSSSTTSIKENWTCTWSSRYIIHKTAEHKLLRNEKYPTEPKQDGENSEHNSLVQEELILGIGSMHVSSEMTSRCKR